MSRPSRETVMTALFNQLVNSIVTPFTADIEAGQVTLVNPSVSAGLFLGLPVFGQGIPRGAVIAGLSPLTISEPATANAVGVQMTTGFVTTTRRGKFTADVPQPALWLRGKEEELEYQGLMQAQTIRAEYIVSTDVGQDPDAIPETALNNFLDALQAALEPDSMTGQFTLGGLVGWCRMVGKIEKSTGDLGTIGIVVGDIEIIVP